MRDQPDEEIRRIAWRNAPAWAIEAGWDNPDDEGGPLPGGRYCPPGLQAKTPHNHGACEARWKEQQP